MQMSQEKKLRKSYMIPEWKYKFFPTPFDIIKC